MPGRVIEGGVLNKRSGNRGAPVAAPMHSWPNRKGLEPLRSDFDYWVFTNRIPWLLLKEPSELMSYVVLLPFESQIVTNSPSPADHFPEYLPPDSKFSIAVLPP